MKKFLTKTLIYFFVFVFSTSLLVYVLDKDLKKSEYENFKDWNNIFNHRINSQVIIQGNSRALYQYNTYILDSILNTNSYNFGLLGARFDVQYIRYQMYMKNNQHPKVIIQNVDQFTFFKTNYLCEVFQYLPYLDNIDFGNKLIKTSLPYYKVYLPFLKYSGQRGTIKTGAVESVSKRVFKSARYKGFNPYDKKWTGPHIASFKKIAIETGWKVDSNSLILFKEFMQDCANKNIKVVLVYAPIYKDIIKLTDNFDNFILLYRNLAKEYNCPFLDYSKDSICLDTTYFVDAIHLNSVGNKKFTTKLALKLKEMNLLN